MSSRNPKDPIVRKRPSYIPIRVGRATSTKGSQDDQPNSNSKNNKHKSISKDKAKRKESNVKAQYESSQKATGSEKDVQLSFMNLLANLKKDYLNTIPHKSSSKEDENKTSDTGLAVPPLPPPTKEFYDNALLEHVTFIATHDQVSGEDTNSQNDTQTSKEKKTVDNDDENKVEKSRRQTNQADSLLATDDMEKEERLVDLTMDFDDIVYEDAEKSLSGIDNNTNCDPKESATGSGSWLLFNSKDEFPNCEDNKYKNIFEDDEETGNAFLGMERILTEGGYMSPIHLGTEKMTPENSNQSRQVIVEQNNPNIDNEQHLNRISSPDKEKKGVKRIIDFNDISLFDMPKRKY